MHGIVDIKGHQYRVKTGDIIDVEKVDGEVGENVELDNVLLVSGESVIIGTPKVDGAKVVCKVVKQDRSKKKIVFRRSPGKYQKKNGHRQHFTALLVCEVHDGQGKSDSVDKNDPKVKKFFS